MATPNPDHYLDHAIKLAASPGGGGAARHADLRRAISSAYYALFHLVMASAAELVAPKNEPVFFSLVYRSIDHKTIWEVAKDLTKKTAPQKYSPYIPQGGFHADITDFATAIYEMQEKRHKADYDPLARMTRSDTLIAIQTARAALQKFRGADPHHRRAFLFLLLFKPR